MNDMRDKDQPMIHELRKTLHSQLQKASKKLEKQKEELDEAQKHLWYKQIGDSLLAIPPAQNKRGQQTLILLNVHTQAEESITLNPKLDLKENSALLFKKAKKGKRGADVSLKKVESTQNEVTELSDLQSRCDEVIRSKSEPDQELLDLLQSTIKKYSNEPQQPASKPGQPTVKVPYRHIQLDDWDIYIGKTDTQNDELSIHFAKPSDIWMHVAGHAGSHVVIRRKKNEEVPPRDVLEKCAAMAVWFSKAKHTSYSEVHYTEARFVRKRRHSPPGEVQIERYKSIRVSPKSPQELFPSTLFTQEQE